MHRWVTVRKFTDIATEQLITEPLKWVKRLSDKMFNIT